MTKNNNIEIQILETSKQLFMTYGIRSITMDEIARKVRISKKTLYSYIREKKDLIEKILFYEMERFSQKIEKIIQESENAIERLIKINNQMLKTIAQEPPQIKHDLKKYYPDLAEKISKEMNSRMFKGIVRNLQQGIKEGVFRKDINPEIIAQIQIIRSKALLEEGYSEIEKKYTKEQILKETFKYHIYGIATEKGIELYKKYHKNLAL